MCLFILTAPTRLAEEKAIDVRAVYLDVASGAILVSQRRLVVEVRRVRRADLVRVTVTLETELPRSRARQQLGVC